MKHDVSNLSMLGFWARPTCGGDTCHRPPKQMKDLLDQGVMCSQIIVLCKLSSASLCGIMRPQHSLINAIAASLSLVRGKS